MMFNSTGIFEMCINCSPSFPMIKDNNIAKTTSYDDIMANGLKRNIWKPAAYFNHSAISRS